MRSKSPTTLWIELFMVQDALKYYAAHKLYYIDVCELQLDEHKRHEQLVESHYGDFTREILSRRECCRRRSLSN